MRKLFFLNLFFVVCSAVMASDIRWNDMEVIQDYLYEGKGCYTIYHPYIVMQGVLFDDYIMLYAQNNAYMEFASRWCQTTQGAEISKESIQSQSTFCYAADFDDGSTVGVADYPVIIEKGTSVFLAALFTTFMNPENVEIAWVELGYEADDKLRMIRSARDLDGGPMIVGGGAIPEPTAGVLFILGAAVLGLRRRRNRGNDTRPTCYPVWVESTQYRRSYISLWLLCIWNDARIYD